MPIKNPKETTAYFKTRDAIIEIEVAMENLKTNLETGFRNENTFAEIVQARKSLDKLRLYVLKLPQEEDDGK